MSEKNNHYADAQMAIRKPVAQVFEAFINPAITTKFWFTKSSGLLEVNKKVEWAWEMYQVSAPVWVKTIIPNESIIIEWGTGPQQSTVEWSFKVINDNLTYVAITNSGFKATSPEELISQIRDSTGGFTIVLAGLKAYLEHEIELNLIGDKFPAEMRGE